MGQILRGKLEAHDDAGAAGVRKRPEQEAAWREVRGCLAGRTHCCCRPGEEAETHPAHWAGRLPCCSVVPALHFHNSKPFAPNAFAFNWRRNFICILCQAARAGGCRSCAIPCRLTKGTLQTASKSYRLVTGSGSRAGFEAVEH